MRLSLIALLLLPSLASAVPLQLAHQGRLLDATGAPLDGGHDLTVTLYDAPAGGTALWTDTFEADLDAGYFSVVLGSEAPLDSGVFDASALWVGLTVASGAELPHRVPLTSVPYAIRAGTATSVSGGVVDATEIRIGGERVIGPEGTTSWSLLTDVPAGFADGEDADTLADVALACDEGELVTFAATGWICAPLEVHASDIVSGTIGIERLPIGTSGDEVAVGNHTHTASDVGALPASGGTLTGALNGTEATFSGSVRLGDGGDACGGGDEGTIRWDGVDFLGCTSKGWVRLGGTAASGSSADHPAETCKTLLDADPDAPDGVYWIDPDGSGDAFKTYCDMTTDGGGWTLAGWSFAGATSTNTANQNFRSLQCGGGDWTPESRGAGSAAIDARALAKSSTEVAFAMTTNGSSIANGGLRTYGKAWKFTIPDPSKVHFNNHSYRTTGWGTGPSQAGACVPVTVTGIWNDSYTGTKYTLANVLGTTWTDSYPTGYGVSSNSNCHNHDGGPFVTSIHSGTPNNTNGVTVSECDVVKGSLTYTHRGNYTPTSVNTTGSSAIWFR